MIPRDRLVAAASVALVLAGPGCWPILGGDLAQQGDADAGTSDADAGTNDADAGTTDAGAAICGDKVIAAIEQCDDGNANDGDGCSSKCTVESGYTCVGQPSRCALPPSCADKPTCGLEAGVSCCDWKTVDGGTFEQGESPTAADCDPDGGFAAGACENDTVPVFQSRVPTFALDTFEVTVGRFRKFVAAYPMLSLADGQGAKAGHDLTGWNNAWSDGGNIPKDDAGVPTAASLETDLACDPKATWTHMAINENKAINCVRWYLAEAFCIWDGGRLPSESEWEYAAAGGDREWDLPWGGSAPDILHAWYVDNSDETIHNVGTLPKGAGRWGQQDLAGNVLEWVLDSYPDPGIKEPYYPSSPQDDYVHFNPLRGGGTLRGGGFASPGRWLRTRTRTQNTPVTRYYEYGFRCAHDLPAP